MTSEGGVICSFDNHTGHYAHTVVGDVLEDVAPCTFTQLIIFFLNFRAALETLTIGV